MLNDVIVAQCQDVSLSIAQNSELLYKLGSHSATDSYRRVLDITGSFRASWLNKDLLAKLLQQIKADGSNSNAYSEVVDESSPTSKFKITFNNGASEQIVIEMTGLSITDQAISGIEPVEPIFEEINWQVKTISVVAKSTLSAEP